jgi:hypothetical protein
MNPNSLTNPMSPMNLNSPMNPAGPNNLNSPLNPANVNNLNSLGESDECDERDGYAVGWDVEVVSWVLVVRWRTNRSKFLMWRC